MPGTPIGLDKMYYALLTKDDTTGVTYSAPKKLTGAITANINPNTARGTLFADNGPSEVASTLGEITLEVSVVDIPSTAQADVLGHTIDAKGIVVSKGGDTPPWIAVGFRALKSNGEYRYVWLLKGKFSEPEAKHETRGDSVNFQPPTMTGSFVKREFDDQWRRQVESDEPLFLQADQDAWFTAVEPVVV
jgi:phi13 family phage major tail protein